MEKITDCPQCHGLTHELHFKEWVKVKGKCPNCRKTLKTGIILLFTRRLENLSIKINRSVNLE